MFPTWLKLLHWLHIRGSLHHSHLHLPTPSLVGSHSQQRKTTTQYGCWTKHRGENPTKWMVYNGKSLLKLMILGYPYYFWKHPYNCCPSTNGCTIVHYFVSEHFAHKLIFSSSDFNFTSHSLKLTNRPENRPKPRSKVFQPTSFSCKLLVPWRVHPRSLQSPRKMVVGRRSFPFGFRSLFRGKLAVKLWGGNISGQITN